MGLVKRTYVDQETVITAENLNDIQDAIIENEEAIEDQGEAIEGKYAKPSGGIPASDMASGVQTSLGKADTAYQKPSGGIPSTDLASGVQTSLGKADTAYQKPSGGIPSTDMASAVQTSLGKADTAYQKPSGGIPSTDLASGVQTSLGKADTALQSSDIDNTLSVTGKAADAKKTGDEISDVRNTLNHLEDGLAIIVNGDTCTTAVPVGGYAYIKNNTHGLAEGLYTNTSASAFPTSGGTANSSVFTAVPGGGLNSLKNTFTYVNQTISGTNDNDDILIQITSILTAVGPQNWANGFYSGPFYNHGPRPGISDWAGMFIIAKIYDGYYGSKGYLVAQGQFFLIDYAAGNWTVTREAAENYTYTMSVTTPADHYNYIDISKTQNGRFYPRIIANIATNQAWTLRAYSYNDSTFRIIITDLNGSSISQECPLTLLLLP